MKRNHKILIVDDEPNNLKVLQQVLKDHYQLLFATSGKKAIDAAITHRPDLILLDIMMPDMDGYTVCRELKKEETTKKTPIIFVTAMSDMKDEARGFDMGAVDYILKPISTPIVLRRVQNHLSLVRMDDLDQLAKASICMLGDAGHYNDTDTGEHIWRMASYAAMLAHACGWSDDNVELLELSAPMHDTGKIGTPDHILKAPRKLSPEEWSIMKQHTSIGHDILSQSDNPVFIMAAEIALYHHERWDGQGYPYGLIGEAIPESARIVAIADVFDALTMKRPYKEAWPLDKAFETIKNESGKHFDPRLAKLFTECKEEILAIKEKWHD